jgi:hypothetical protein
MRRFIIVLVLALLMFGIAAAPASANWPKYDKIPNAAFFVPGPNIWYEWLGANKYSDGYDAALTPIPAGYSVYLASFFSDGVRANAEQVPGHSLLLSGTIWDQDGNVVGEFPEAFIALTWSPVFHDNNSGWVRESVIPVGVLASGTYTMTARGRLTETVNGLERGDHHPRWIPYTAEPFDDTFWTGFTVGD